MFFWKAIAVFHWKLRSRSPFCPNEKLGASVRSLFFCYYAGFLRYSPKFLAPIGAGIPI